MLFAGPDGVGKKTLALAVAQAALCERAPVAEACGECRPCRKVTAALRPERLDEARDEADRHPDEDVWRNFRLHPDLVLAEGWWLTRTGRPRPEPEIRVDQVRDLIGEIAGAPFEARRRVFVVDDAHTHERGGPERPPQEPRGAAAALARHPGLGGSARACARRSARAARSCASGRSRRDAVAAFLAERGAATRGGGRAAGRPGRRQPGGGPRLRVRGLHAGCGSRSWPSSSGRTAWTPWAAWRRRRTLEQAEDPALLLTTLRSLLRDVAALRAGAGRIGPREPRRGRPPRPPRVGAARGAGGAASPERAGEAASRCAASRASS